MEKLDVIEFFMREIIRGALFAIAILFGLVHLPSPGAPRQPSRAELIRADLGLSREIDEKNMSVVVFMPEMCKARDLPRICVQFLQIAGAEKKYAYQASTGLARQRSIVGQVQSLPAAYKARRFVVLLDWRLLVDQLAPAPQLTLNGEVVVYDQLDNKVVWHAVVLHGLWPNTSPDTFASEYINKVALRDIWVHMGLRLQLAKLGAEPCTLPAQVGAGEQCKLVIANRRPYEAARGLEQTHILTISAVPDAGGMPVSLELPPGTHLALNLPPGRYALHDLRTAPVEFDAGERPLAYRLGRGAAGEPRYTMAPIGLDEAAQDAAETINRLAPGRREDPGRTAQLDWSDIPPESTVPVPSTP